MLRRRRTGCCALAVALAVATLSGCAATRAESSPPDPRFGPTTTTATLPSTTATPAASNTSEPSPTPDASGEQAASDPTTEGDRTPATRAPTTTTDPLAGTVAEHVSWKAFDRSLRERLIGGGDQAASVAVAVDGEVVHQAAYGERVPGQEAKPKHRFRIASLSKVIMASTVLRFVESDELALDDRPLAELADDLGVRIEDRRIRRVTLRQLLGHTSGFGDFENEFFGAGVESCREAAQVGLRSSLEFRPGGSYNYSNMNYCVLGLVLESVTGRAYGRVQTAQLLDPLNITNMRLAGTFDVRAGDVRHRTSPRRNYMETLGGAGAWLATPTDLVRVVDSLDPDKPGWKPLSAKTTKLMKRPSSPNRTGEPRTSWYGLGLINYDDGSYGHTGTLENTHTMVLARPDGVTWAVFVSGENPWESSDLRVIVDDAFAVARTRG